MMHHREVSFKGFRVLGLQVGDLCVFVCVCVCVWCVWAAGRGVCVCVCVVRVGYRLSALEGYMPCSLLQSAPTRFLSCFGGEDLSCFDWLIYNPKVPRDL